MRNAVLKTITVMLVLAVPVCAQDWAQWRGENRDGVLRDAKLVDSLDDLKTNWTQPVSSGYSGPTVSDGRVYLMDRKEKPKQTERILCFDEESGKPLWQHEYDAEYRGVGYVAGPRASVTIAGGKAYSIGTMGHAYCLDAKSGKEIWKCDFDQNYKITESKRMPIWGITASPLIYEDVAIFHVGGNGNCCIVALDKNTGKQKWTALKDRAQYSSPVLAKQNGKDVLICWTGDSVAGLNPKDGQTFWRFEFSPRNMPIGVATPVIKDGHIFLTSFYDGSLMLKMNDKEMSVEQTWKAIGENERSTKALHSMISTPVWIDDHIYGVDSYGELRGISAKDGKRVWENSEAVPRARWSTIHFVRDGKRVWMFNERGDLILGALDPDGYKEISRANIIKPTKNQLNRRGGVCWSHPAFAGSNINVRNDKEIKIVSLKQK